MFVLRELLSQSLSSISRTTLGGCCRRTFAREFPGGAAATFSARALHTATVRCSAEKDLQPTAKELQPRERFFQEKAVKNRETFLQLIDGYDRTDKVKRGHIEFIYAALHCMGEYGVSGDVEVYKRLMDIFPKGKMIPKHLIQAEFMHFGRHQECGVYLLDHMEHEGVVPDLELKDIVLAVFGQSSIVYKKYARMLYWMPKLKNINPFLLPDPLPQDPRELARLALRKMARDRRTRLEDYHTEQLEDASDKTWIVSAQSCAQQRLLEEHPEQRALYVEGPTLVWLRRVSMTYFVLRADPKVCPASDVDDDDVSNLSLHMFGEPRQLDLLRPSLHEQEEGVVMAMCCTGTSSKDSLLSWIRLLRATNPCLDSVPVLFKIRTSPATLVAVNNTGREREEGEQALEEELEAERTEGDGRS